MIFGGAGFAVGPLGFPLVAPGGCEAPGRSSVSPVAGAAGAAPAGSSPGPRSLLAMQARDPRHQVFDFCRIDIGPEKFDFFYRVLLADAWPH